MLSKFTDHSDEEDRADTRPNKWASPNRWHRSAGLLGTLLAVALLGTARAETPAETSSSSAAANGSAVASAPLPEDPGSVARHFVPAISRSELANRRNWLDGVVFSGEPASPVASRRARLIQPGQVAPPLTPRDKAAMGLDHAFSPLAVVGWFASAGYGQLTDGYPHYGVDRGAFGMRLGSSALRDSSEAVFSDSVAAPALHEDLRYYRMGSHRSIGRRIAYSISRPLLARSDSGRTTVNIALMTGTLAGAALTNAYYPANSRGAAITFRTYGWSMEGSAVGDLVREFYGDVGEAIYAHREREAGR